MLKDFKDNIDSSFAFRCKQDSFFDFIDKNKLTLFISSSIFFAAYLFIIFFIDVEFFYSRLFDDPLLYYLKGYQFAHSGNTDAVLAENLSPFTCIAMPGILRLPVYLITDSFAMQLRLFQIYNLLVVVLIGCMFSYYLSLLIPKQFIYLSISIPFIYLIMVTTWQSNVLLPFSDAFLTFFSFGSFIAITNTKRLTLRSPKILFKLVMILLLIIVACMIKFTSIFIFIFAIIFWLPMFVKPESKKVLIISAFVYFTVLLIVFYLQHETIIEIAKGLIGTHFKKYRISELLFALCTYALPSQIVPNYAAFYNPVSAGHAFTNNMLISKNASSLIVIGLIITFFILYGMWVSRKRFFPEIIFSLLVIPVLSIIPDSTPRYLNSYQVLFWIFFICGLYRIVKIVPEKLVRLSLKWVFINSILLYLLFAFISFQRFESRNRVNIHSFSAVFSETAAVYKDLENYLSKLPARNSRFLLTSGDKGKWRAISGIEYFDPNGNLKEKVGQYDLYLVIDTISRHSKNFNDAEREVLNSIAKYGAFHIEKVFSRRNNFAAASVFKIKPISLKVS